MICSNEMQEEYRITSEVEADGFWLYEIDCLQSGEVITTSRLRLAWADYDMWVPDGTVEPACVADALFRYLHQHPEFEQLPDVVDSSHPRRLDKGADDAIAGLIRNIPPT